MLKIFYFRIVKEIDKIGRNTLQYEKSQSLSLNSEIELLESNT